MFFSGSILARMPDFFVKFWVEMNINISNEFNLTNEIHSLTHLAYIANGKTSCSILQQFTGLQCVTLFGAVLSRHPSSRPCLLDVKRCNVVFAHYKRNKYNNYVNACITFKPLAGFLQCNGRKLEESEGYNCFLDQLKCVNC